MTSQPLPTLRRRSLLGWASIGLVLVFAGIILLIGLPSRTRWMLIGSCVVMVAMIVWAAVQGRRDRNRYEEAISQYAAATAVARQRLDLARKLHDAVSHRLGAITVRAAIAQRMPERALSMETMALIEETSRTATDELRRALNALGEPETKEQSSQSGVAALHSLFASAERDGLRITHRIDLERALSDRVDSAVTALVREALNNAIQHAGPTGVAVSVAELSGEVQLRIVNDAPAPEWRPAPGTGRGLSTLGVQFRALGGSLEYGVTDEGSWLVNATLPTDEPRL